jgi:hypothetical protein
MAIFVYGLQHIQDTNATGYDAPRASKETEHSWAGDRKKTLKIRKKEKLKAEGTALSLLFEEPSL